MRATHSSIEAFTLLNYESYENTSCDEFAIFY